MGSIKDFTFMDCGWNIGDIVEVVDRIDPGIRNVGSIKLIEVDTENPSLMWLYIRANDDVLNTNLDPRIGEYWILSESISPFIIKLSNPVVV